MAALLAALVAPSLAEAQDIAGPHRWRVALSLGGGGVAVDSEVTEQLEEAAYETGGFYDVGLSGERWVHDWLGVGGELWMQRLHIEGDGDPAFDTLSLLLYASVARRLSPSDGGFEVALDLAVGPTVAWWTLRDETASAVGLTGRLGFRIGQGTRSGVSWHLRPWLGSTLGTIGPTELSTAGLLLGADFVLGWGWR